nr:MAG TPA: hypothetical protein [Caudoviricetes sp.]
MSKPIIRWMGGEIQTGKDGFAAFSEAYGLH